jgi:branched-chain amino acid transport system permease protein
MHRPIGYILTLAAVSIGISAPLWLGNYWLGILTVAFYFGVFAMSWDLLFGFAGEVNFGPTFLIGLGAYSAGLMNNAGLGIPVCLIGGALTAIVGGVLLAFPHSASAAPISVW